MVVEHGGNVAALSEQLGYLSEDCLDFSANINPMGLSTRLKKHLTANLEQLLHYPDIHYRKSRTFLADYHQVGFEQVLLANGAVDVFYELAQYFRPQKVLTLSPTFMEYEKAFLQVGSKVSYHVLDAPDYSWNFESMLPSLEDLSAGDLLVVCNPNNPTGSLVDAKELMRLDDYLVAKGIVLVLDEAFLDFLEEEEHYSFIPHLKSYPNTVVVRSLTKFYALPGLRLGYALTYHPSCFKEISEKRPPWTINALADSAVPIILSDRAYQKQTRAWLKAEQDFLFEGLLAMSAFSVLRPTVNYIFFEFHGGFDLRERLWEQKIFIRSCKNYHHLTQNHYRIAVRSRKENEQLLRALKEVCHG